MCRCVNNKSAFCRSSVPPPILPPPNLNPYSYTTSIAINMKLATIALLTGSAAAFAPAQVGKATTALSADFSKEAGAMAPLGFFDPLNLLENGDQEYFDRLRATEIKHGRISMLAVWGYIATGTGWRLPGMEEVGTGFKAFENLDKLPFEARGVFPLTLFTMIMLEFSVMQDFAGTAEFPGDLRNGVVDFGWDNFDEATKLKKRNIEINNGRAAMMGILGLMVHEQLGNIDGLIPYWVPGYVH